MTHGKDGWYLADYSWDEKTSLGNFLYERKLENEVESVSVMRFQPATAAHRKPAN